MGQPVAFFLNRFQLSDAVCADKELHNFYVERVLGNSINVHMLRNYLRKFFSCVFIEFLDADATLYGLYDNFRILCAKDH